MTTLQKIKAISSHGAFRIEQWRDKHGSWRAGFEWYTEEDYEFVCEKKTFNEAVDLVFKYVHHRHVENLNTPFEPEA